MKLKYEILWFEDNDSWFNTLSEAIGDFLDSKGFEITIRRYENDEGDLTQILKRMDPNLILMDFRLDEQTGDEIIEEIRGMEIYTDIVFYSSDGAKIIREKIQEKSIDGVFCSGREIHEFEPKVNKIITNTIKKVQDVNNMRGLVIAETIDLEQKLAEILKGYFHIIEEDDLNKKDLLKKICDKKSEQLKKDSKLIVNIYEKHIDELIDKNILTTYNLYTGMQSVLKDNISKLNFLINNKKGEEKDQLIHRKDSLKSIKDTLSYFENDIIHLRNTLAHVKEVIDSESGISHLESIMKNVPKITFDEEKYIDIRQKLREHSANLNDLSQIFLPQPKIVKQP